MQLLVSFEVLDDLNLVKDCVCTYHALGYPGWEAHFVAWIGLVVEVRAPLQEAEDGIKQPVNAGLLVLLSDCEEQIVDLR